MEISQVILSLLLLYSFFFGAIVGMFYDGCRMLRVLAGKRYSKRGYKRIEAWRLPIIKRTLAPKSESVWQSAVTFFGDILCVLFCTAGIIVLNYSYNSGRFRFFTVLGVLAGFFVYKYTLGRLVMLVAEPLVVVFRYLAVSIFILFCAPFLKFGYILYEFVKKINSLYSFTLEKKRKKLYNIDGGVFANEDEPKGSRFADLKTSLHIKKKENGG
ncbi:MAG: hypothetical protein E7642_00090 [Ruminococcaceae bacterium]|nr:hypothetical protein [Oscillospiraceae bacterium]